LKAIALISVCLASAAAMSALSEAEMSAVVGRCSIQEGPCIKEAITPQCCHPQWDICTGESYTSYHGACHNIDETVCYREMSEQTLAIYKCIQEGDPCPCSLIYEGEQTVRVPWCEGLW